MGAANSNLVRLIYRSKHIGSLDHDLTHILETANIRNTRDEISGVLLYGSGHFLQVLEGSSAKIEALYEDICRDPRHTDVSIVLEDRIEDRLFSSWAMAFTPLTNETVEQPVGSISVRDKNDVSRLLGDPSHYIGGFLNSVVEELTQVSFDGR